MMKPTYRTLASVAALSVVAASPAFAADPQKKADDTWISVSGQVQEVKPNSFTLAYGEDQKNTIRVEMDDRDRDAEAYALRKGDKVTVNGLIDADAFEQKKIEASSVYVENVGTTFYASAADEEDIATWTIVSVPVVVSQTWLEGVVTGVAGDEFTLSTGTTKIEVEVDGMAYNPLDDEGYQKIEKGDRVRVGGDMDYDFFEGRVFEADAVVTLRDASAEKKGKPASAE